MRVLLSCIAAAVVTQSAAYNVLRAPLTCSQQSSDIASASRTTVLVVNTKTAHGCINYRQVASSTSVCDAVAAAISNCQKNRLLGPDTTPIRASLDDQPRSADSRRGSWSAN